MNRFVQGPVQGAAHGVNAVRTLDCYPCRFRRHQLHGNVNAPNNQRTWTYWDAAIERFLLMLAKNNFARGAMRRGMAQPI